MLKNSIKLNVYWGDTDMAGIIFYPTYFRWFDQGWFYLFRKMNIDVKEMFDNYNLAFPIIDVGCTFHTPLFHGDEIQVVTEVEKITNKTFKLRYTIYRDDVMTGEGHELRSWVHFKDNKLKALPIPEEVKNLMIKDI